MDEVLRGEATKIIKIYCSYLGKNFEDDLTDENIGYIIQLFVNGIGPAVILSILRNNAEAGREICLKRLSQCEPDALMEKFRRYEKRKIRVDVKGHEFSNTPEARDFILRRLKEIRRKLKDDDSNVRLIEEEAQLKIVLNEVSKS